MNDGITQLSIKALLNSGVDYVIPMYQRNYAWDEGEISQLIQDIIDYLPTASDEGQNYYIGTLVVCERKNSTPLMFETIDGQQRLTTLSLLASYLKNKHAVDLSWYQALRIHFDSREHSQKTFATIFAGNFANDPAEVLGEKEINAAILNGYRLIAKVLPQKLRENGRQLVDFARYLFRRVYILRVKVPDDTDLNHYFEVMNNRGEQLEKHEVLKSKMMEVLNGISDEGDRRQSQNCLHAVWDACANMERYVQMGFSPAQRGAIFGEKNWGRFEMTDFDSLREAFHKPDHESLTRPIARSLSDIIATAQDGVKRNEVDDEAPERFNTVVNFANFLLHVLRVDTESDIPLDDKRLVSIFESEVLRRTDAIARVKRFVFALLRCKYLFDHYVIKREFINGSDRWSLKSLKWNDGGDRAGKPSYVNSFGDEDNAGINRRILMLLSAFHVSTPTMVYKHWLNAALHHLFQTNGAVQPQVYLGYLESVAKAFVFDRFVAPDKGAKEYFEIIYSNKGVCQAVRGQISVQWLKMCLSFEHLENNLVFNFLDYLLWLEHGLIEPVASYEFSFRSSVEHYYPQHPLPGHDHLDPGVLHSFGNLCLISHSKNSRLSNYMPSQKKEHYKVGALDSVKQYLMMRFDPWDADAIEAHHEHMIGVLLGSLGSHADS